MAPQQHLTWLHDNIEWFESVPVSMVLRPVPTCPGWTVEDVVNHLSFGVGLSYPVAVSKGPATKPEKVFAGIGRPAANPIGEAALNTFSENMRRCHESFQFVDPETPCWTYEGPGQAKFWFRRAAIETTLHRMDVEEALQGDHQPLPNERATDAIEETLEFALPLAATMTKTPKGRLNISIPGLDLGVGSGRRQATISGEHERVLSALWGRHREQVNVTGDVRVANAWLSLIDVAFAGR